MSTRQLEMLAPLASPLPDLPPGDPFSEEQWKILMAIMDTVVPSVHRETAATDKISHLSVPDVLYKTAADNIKNSVVNAPSSEDFDDFLSQRPSQNPDFRPLTTRYLDQYAPDDAKKGLGFVLSTLKYVSASFSLKNVC
jgi:hypothetical protein